MAEAAVTFLLETVTGIMEYNVKLLADADVEFHRLQDELEKLRACLKEAADRPGKGYDFKVIEKQMREAIYDVEDTLDAYLNEAEAAAAQVKQSKRSVRSRK